jgi:deoxycytidine triphosphate deaminase
MILSDRDILKEINSRGIICKPFNRANLSNSSIDLRLGTFIAKQRAELPVRFKVDESGKLAIDSEIATYKQDISILPNNKYLLCPGEFILAETLEYVGSNSDLIVAQVADKSTLARLGLSVCFSAGYIDAKNSLKITLEIKNHGDLTIELQYGMHICQLKFFYLSSHCIQPYNGKYVNSTGVEVAI